MTTPTASNPLLTRFHNTETFCAGAMDERIVALLNQGHAVTESAEFKEAARELAAEDGFWPEPGSWMNYYRPYNVRDGILYIPVKGFLLHDFSYTIGDWMTGYEYIWRAFIRGVEDDGVKAIALLIDSPGGEVAGNFDLVDRMFELRGEKPVASLVYEMGYSAAYSIASVGKIYVSRTGGVGSIGVLTSHYDLSGYYEQRGIKKTYVFAGKHKVDGNETEPLADDVRARMQDRIDELYGIFTSTVARNRGMDEQAVRNTEALTFTASQAVSNGLADYVATLDDAIAAFAADLSTSEGDEQMSNKDTTAENTSADNAAALATARTEGATAERERISAIVNSEAGKARPKAALKMATNDKFAAVDATAIVEMLADLPEETAAAPTTDAAEPTAGAPKGMLEAAMANGNPEVGGAGAESGKTDAASKTDSILALARNHGVAGLKKKDN